MIIFDTVHERDAITVVDFMLQDAGQKTFGFDADFMAIDINRFDADFTVARDFAVALFDAQTTFVVGDHGADAFDDFGVDEWCKFTDGFVVEIRADDNDAERIINLNGG